jgi:hypothetical protein
MVVSKAVLKAIGLLRPKFYQDGNAFCFLYGGNLQDGIAGFGNTPAEAACDFYDSFHERKPLDPPPVRIQ